MSGSTSVNTISNDARQCKYEYYPIELVHAYISANRENVLNKLIE